MHKLVLLVLLVAPAWGQSKELWFSTGASVFTHNGLGSPLPNGSQEDTLMKGGWNFAIRAAFNNRENLGHEIQYTYGRAKLESAIPGLSFPKHSWQNHGAGYNFLIYSYPPHVRVRPFLTGGAHFASYNPPDAVGGKIYNKFGLNYGGGVKIRMAEQWGLRFDIRQYATPKPLELKPRNGWLLQNEFSGGVGWVF